MFLLVAQIFSSKLENRQDIKGIAISGINILLSLFADDTDLFLKASIECLEAVISEIISFGIHSGCKYNVEKTTCIPLGRAKHNLNLLNRINEKNYGPNFIQHEFIALGIKFTNNMSVAEIMAMKLKLPRQNLGLMCGIEEI